MEKGVKARPHEPSRLRGVHREHTALPPVPAYDEGNAGPLLVPWTALLADAARLSCGKAGTSCSSLPWR